MWLPLALADLKLAILAPWIKREDHKHFTLSKTLAGWCLPLMSRALASAEEEQAAKALFDSVKNLAERQNRK